MKKIFTLLSGLLLLSALPANAENVYVYVLNWDKTNKEYVDVAKPFSTELTKSNDGVYTLANINDSENKIPLSFTFPEPEVGSYDNLTFTGENLYRTKGYDDYPFILDNGDYAVCVYKNVESGENFNVDYPYVCENGYSWIEKYEPENSDEYQYWAYISMEGELEDESYFEAYLAVGFNYIMSPAELEANQKAYEAVLAEIEAVQAKYDEAVEAIEKEYPGIDLGEWKEIIGGKLAEQKAAAEQALNAANEDGEKYSFPFDAEEYDGMIAEMKKAAPNQAAYSKVMAIINALQEEYDEAVETIKEVNPEFDFTEWTEIETKIAEAKQGADAALADVNENGGEFTFAFDGQDIEAFIIEMKKAGYAEHNNLAYDKVVAAIAEVEAEYTAAVADIEKEYEGIDLDEWKQIIGGQLDEIKKGAEQALAAANENGELFNFAFDGEEYEGMIEEMKKQAPNQAAYGKVLDEINAVEEEYNDAVEAIKEVNPEFDFAEWTEIETQIADAKKNAATALANANEDGEEFSYAFGAEDIENFIIEMKKAGFADYNQAAYDQAIADIAALEAKYDAAVVAIEEANPDFDINEWKEIIGGQLAEAKSGAEQAYSVASEYGEKFFFPVDTETFEGMIEQMKQDAGLSGIANIEAEIAAGKAKIFTLDGKAHFAPVKGQVNVIVRENSTVKVMVK